MTKARDIADFKFENIVDTGTEGTKVALGTTAQRGSTQGQFRFNSETGKFEGGNGSTFISIEGTPVVSSVANTNITQAQIDAGFDLVITGNNFSSGDTVKFIANDDTEFTSPTTTINSDTQISARVTSTIDATKEPYKIQVISAGGLTGILNNAFNIDAKPIYTTASGNILNTFEGSSVNTSIVATDPESDAITFAVQSGSLPTGLSISSGGVITGTAPSVSGSETSNFTIRATSGTNTTDRAFNIVVGDQPTGGTISTYSSGGVNYRVHTFTSSGSLVYPIDNAVSILIVAGGGAGGAGTGGGGGAGGLIYIPSYNLVSGTWTCTIGNGGIGDSTDVGTAGENTIFTNGSRTLTALGGGYGGATEDTSSYSSSSGGSGGGGTDYYDAANTAGAATQPANTSDGVNTYNSTGFGNQGGGGDNIPQTAWGGGGAGGYPTSTAQPACTYGGDGKQYDISGSNAYYAAGGQGGTGNPSYVNRTNNIGGSHTGSNGTAGVANTGSGGGGGWSHSSGTGGNGGSGIIIIRYVV